jgi:5-methylcytosine-specific restriction endonuclease McrA
MKRRPKYVPRKADDNPEYIAYLKSPEWSALRTRLFAERGNKCACCGKSKDLRLHHKTYVRLYDEMDSDLEVLCEDCHDGLHARWGKIAKRASQAAIKEVALCISFYKTK